MNNFWDTPYSDGFSGFLEHFFRVPVAAIRHVVYTSRRNLVNAWQRAIRGYDDFDLWNTNTRFLDRTIPILEYLIANKRGVPGYLMRGNTIEEMEEDLDRAREEWDGIMKKMLSGLIAARRISENEHLVGGSIDWDALDDWRMEFGEGMELFVEHFDALWD